MAEFRGRSCIDGWPERLAAAQAVKTWVGPDDVEYNREPYNGNMPDPQGYCHDCIAKVGELHVPGCDVERCPRCGGQAISCPCNYEDED
jgi:hypothetical protein